jgi:hypothetical protein
MASLTRQDIVDALAPVAGVSPSLFRPTVIAPGQAWPTMRGWTRDEGPLFRQRWGVYLVLANDDRAAAAQWDLLVPGVLQALWPIMTVDEIQAAKLTDDTAAPLCAIFVARSE